jgi:hypothetical protein
MAIAAKNKIQTATKALAVMNGPRRATGLAGTPVDFIDIRLSLDGRPDEDCAMRSLARQLPRLRAC